jgi:hypothetical protein
LGPGPLGRFVGSYRRHDAGTPHRLLVLFNGFTAEDDLSPWRRLLAGLEHEELRLERPVVDLAAYIQAAQRIGATRYCFLNSHSVIRTDRWLALLTSIAARPGVGAVGATGSWASQASYLRLDLALGGPYRRVFADRVATIRTLASLSPDKLPPAPAPDPLRGALSGGRTLLNYTIAYASFPCPHLRTNCFLIDRDVWLQVCSGLPTDKGEAYLFESGRRGMTARLKATGLRVLVAGRDGRAYEASEWAASRTFWQGNQENLLVEDNQTRSYRDGDVNVRRALSGFAWGRLADPDEPPLPEVA